MKPKAKEKSKLPIDFISPFPLEACVHRLESKEGRERDFWMRPAYKISLARVDADTYRFSIAKRASRGYSANIGGYLKRHDSESTLVLAGPKGAIAMIVVMIALLVMMFAVGLTSRMPGNVMLFYVLVLPLVGVGGWVYWKMETTALTRTLQDMLGCIPLE